MLNCTDALPSGGIKLVGHETELFHAYVISAKLFFTSPSCGVEYAKN